MPTTHELAAMICTELQRIDGWRRWAWAVGPSVSGAIASSLGLASANSILPALREALARLESAGLVELTDGEVRLSAAGALALR